MNEPTDPIDLGVWDHDDDSDSDDDQENPLEGQPAGEYHLYAERIIDASLAERMSDHWGEWWKWTVRSDQDRHFRMQMLIDEFGLVERSKLPDPVDVPDDVKEAATFVFFNGWGAGSVENVDTIARWVLEQVGDSGG